MATSKTSPTAGEISDSTTAAPAVPTEDLGTVVDVPNVPVPPAAEPPKMADLKGVRYVGTADKKTLTVNDLIGVGVENPKGDLVFSKDNDRFIPGSEINASTRDYLAAQSDFVIE